MARKQVDLKLDKCLKEGFMATFFNW